jgi:cyclic beta-1,2-glucan synthetase
MAMLATVAARELGLIGDDELVARLDRTMSTVDSLERFEGHLLNWYDTATLAPLHPRYVSTVDSGNPAGALLVAAQALRRLAAEPGTLADRMDAFADGMSFRFLYDPQRKLFAIGYRLADAEGPGRLDSSYYDLLASEARLVSFLAVTKGEVPQVHWFSLGRPLANVGGVPTLLSWSATLFEYLMPFLYMKTYPGTLLDQSSRRSACRASASSGVSPRSSWSRRMRRRSRSLSSRRRRSRT